MISDGRLVERFVARLTQFAGVCLLLLGLMQQKEGILNVDPAYRCSVDSSQ